MALEGPFQAPAWKGPYVLQMAREHGSLSLILRFLLSQKTETNKKEKEYVLE